jgi:hypothetical protein
MTPFFERKYIKENQQYCTFVSGLTHFSAIIVAISLKNNNNEFQENLPSANY